MLGLKAIEIYFFFFPKCKHTEFKYLATLIFKHNLTIEQIEQIDKYEISK